MDVSDEIQEKTFRVNFSGDGSARLKEEVREKLKEFMGEYTDDTLVEYVIVLLRNGKHKQEVENELNVFLEDGSTIFVSWLWDHLSSNLHLYMQPPDSFTDEAAKAIPILDKKIVVEDDSRTEPLGGSIQLDSAYDGEKFVRDSRRRRNREWKGLVRDDEETPISVQNTETDGFQSKEKKADHRSLRMRRSSSPLLRAQKKRTRQDGQQLTKREVASLHPTANAPRRLLQFAVRDAVSSLQSPTSRLEPTVKRLRSVVSTPTEDSSMEDLSHKKRTVAMAPPHAMATAMKAAAEAAQDVVKVRSSRNVFDRLGLGADMTESVDQSPQLSRPPALEAGGGGEEYFQGTAYDREFEGSMTLLERETGLASDSASDDDRYHHRGTMRHGVLDASQCVSSVNRDDPLMVHYSVAQDKEKIARKTMMEDQDQTNTSHKIVNISVNVNTWKPPHYLAPRQVPRELREVETRPTLLESELDQGRHTGLPMKEDNKIIPGNDNEMPHAVTQKEAQKNAPSTPGSYSTVRPADDTDSRTIFISNVHFAATKDALSRHFNKFGEVLKVIIATDAATGQPKGSAYVEFTRKEAAELALSLNGTSFMSRILKVVRGGSAQNESPPVMGWPHMARPSFASRLVRMPFPRGIAGAFRGRFPTRPGRSMQWKRDASSSTTVGAGDSIGNLHNNVSLPTSRSLSYVRTDRKSEGNPGYV